MSQLNFFLLSDEIFERLNLIVDNTDTLIFSGQTFEHEYPDPLKIPKADLPPDHLTFWLKNDQKSPKAKIINEGIAEGKFNFDYYKDPIIHFTNCRTRQMTMSPGRIFYKAGWIDDEKLRSEHKKWTEKISRIMNKNLKKLNKFWHISAATEAWVNKNGSLELGPGGMIINKQNICIQ